MKAEQFEGGKLPLVDEDVGATDWLKSGLISGRETVRGIQRAGQLNFWQQSARLDKDAEKTLSAYIEISGLGKFDCDFEVWAINESTKDLSYLTHGVLRFFGKFPPPVAKRFIRDLHNPGIGPVVDPTAGSGTTLVEAVLARRSAIGLDANPFSVLLSKVKTSPVTKQMVERALLRMQVISYTEEQLNRVIPYDRFLRHWFSPETIEALGKLRYQIELVECEEQTKNLLLLALGSIVRRSSKASNNLARLFLDPNKPPLPVEDAFLTQVRRITQSVEGLEHLNPRMDVKLHDSREPFLETEFTNLVICHPPYFNVCKYASVLKYELLWTGADYQSTRRRELRDGFKVGRAELVSDYVEDMSRVMSNCYRILTGGGWLVLMIGDTEIQSKRIRTSLMVAEQAQNLGFRLRRVIFRVPKYTEASYAATQRRTAAEVGVRFADHIILLEKV